MGGQREPGPQKGRTKKLATRVRVSGLLMAIGTLILFAGANANLRWVSLTGVGIFAISSTIFFREVVSNGDGA